MCFLDEVSPYSVTEQPEMERKFSNWRKVADIIYTLDDTDELVRILQLELTTRRRPLIIERVYSKYSSLKSKNELKKIFARNISDIQQDSTKDTILVNWSRVLKYLNMGSNNNDPQALLDLIDYERKTRNRLYIISRLFTKLQTLRKKTERKEMYAWKPKRQSKSTFANE